VVIAVNLLDEPLPSATLRLALPACPANPTAEVLFGINPIVALEKWLLNMIGKLV
jgi:hypothetical protein